MALTEPFDRPYAKRMITLNVLYPMLGKDQDMYNIY